VEKDRKAAAALKANAGLLERLEQNRRAHVVQTSAERFLRSDDSVFDLIFFDPPFADLRTHQHLQALLDERLAGAGHLYLETSKRSQLPLPDRVLKSATAGDCLFALYR
jgi:16S rRNA G966 N2-methylase RsmD